MNNKKIDRITTITVAISVIVCILFMLLPNGTIARTETNLEYPQKLFGTDIIEINIEADEDEWREMLDNATSETYIPCNLTVNGTEFKMVGIRPKGNSSLSMVAGTDSDRFSFKFQFDQYIDGQTCFGLDKFVANNMQADYTYMKEYFSYYLMNYMGVECPLVNYAHITVNGEEWGTYLAVECYEDSFVERVYQSGSGNLYSVKMAMGRGKEEPGEGLNMKDFEAMKEKFQNGDASDFPDMSNMPVPPDFGGMPGGQNAGTEGNNTATQGNQSSGSMPTIPGGQSTSADSSNMPAMPDNRDEGADGGNMPVPPDFRGMPGNQGEGANGENMPVPPDSRGMPGGQNAGSEGNNTATQGNQSSGSMPTMPGGQSTSADSSNMPAMPGNQGTEAAQNGQEDEDSQNAEDSTRQGPKMIGRGGFGSSAGGGSLVYTDDNSDSYSSIFENAVFKRSGEKDYQRVITALKKLSEGEELEEYFDVDQILRYFAVHTVVVNLDSYISNMQQNYYLYEEDGKVTILPWDYNLTFGGFQSGSVETVINFPIDTPVSGVELSERPLIGKLLEVEQYKQRYHEYLQQIVDFINSGDFAKQVDAVDSLISGYVEKDATAFCTYDQYKSAVETFKKLCQLRAESIQGQLDGTIPSTTDGQSGSDALVAADGISLSTMGSQGGGGMEGAFGGFGGGRGWKNKTTTSNSQSNQANDDGKASAVNSSATDTVSDVDKGSGQSSEGKDSTQMPQMPGEDGTQMPQMPGEDGTQMPQMPGRDSTQMPQMPGEDSTQMQQMPGGDGTQMPQMPSGDGTQMPQMPGMNGGIKNSAIKGIDSESLIWMGVTPVALIAGICFAALYKRKKPSKKK